jgi:membrane-bound serine protease (ClpP class)
VGVFAAGGTVALVLGGLFLFEGAVRIDLAVLVPVALVVGGGSVLAGRLAWRARRTPSLTGPEGLVGRQGVVHDLTDDGRASLRLDGAWWRARATSDGPLTAGQTVRVLELDGLDLLVEPADQPPAPDQDHTPKEAPP